MSATIASSFIGSILTSATTSSPQPSSTDSGNNNGNNNNNNNNSSSGGPNSTNTFYRNLFYILIGLLAAFGIISFISLFRARHRRLRIAAEAQRLGLLVPGMEGYIPIRERRNMSGEARWRKSDGRVLPDWWDVEKVLEDETGSLEEAGRALNGRALAIPLDGLGTVGYADTYPPNHTNNASDFRPLAIIPPTITLPLPQAPRSGLAYFPHHLAYRPEDLDPLPTKFGRDSENANLDELAGERVEVVTIIRMPGDPPKQAGDVEEGEEVLNEWGGVCLGVLKVGVEAGRGARV